MDLDSKEVLPMNGKWAKKSFESTSVSMFTLVQAYFPPLPASCKETYRSDPHIRPCPILNISSS